MYKNSRFKRVNTTQSASKVPVPVVVSQKVSQIPSNSSQEDPEKENEIVACSQDFNIPSSQNEMPGPSQSRFLSQRHTISQVNNELQIRGRNYFEIALITCKLKISDLGE